MFLHILFFAIVLVKNVHNIGTECEEYEVVELKKEEPPPKPPKPVLTVKSKIIKQNLFQQKVYTKVVLTSNVYTLGEKSLPMERIREFDMSVSNVQVIGKEAFRFCVNLRKFIGSDKIVEIRQYAFDSCSRLEEIENINNVKSILDHALSNTKIKEIFLGDQLTYLDFHVFDGCFFLHDIYASGSEFFNLNNDGILRNLITNGIYRFPPGRYGTYTTLPFDQIIYQYAFHECIGITQLCLPEIKTIYSKAFVGCNSLETVHLGKDINEIFEEAFSGVQNLKVFYGGKIVAVSANAFDKSAKVFTTSDHPNIYFGRAKIFKAKKMNIIRKLFGHYESFCHCGLKFIPGSEVKKVFTTQQIGVENPMYSFYDDTS